MQAYKGHTALSDAQVAASTQSPIRVYDLRKDELPVTGAHEEFDIDDFIDGEDVQTQANVASAGAWVADNFYPGQVTLSTLRMKAGLSQKQFGELIGQAQPNVSRYESGKHEPGVMLAVRMAEVLDVSLEQLVFALKNSQ